MVLRAVGFFSPFVILGIAFLFVVLYANTFRGHKIRSLTHGPFNFECGVYRSYALGERDLRLTSDNKLIKHFLCAVLYPVFYRLLSHNFPIKEAPLVCSALGGATIALFGLWIYWRTGRSSLVFPFLLLLGFSFNTWYVSSVWESRAFIMFGGLLLLIALDRLVSRPRLLNLILASSALVFTVLITIGNAYLIPLVPLALVIRARTIGFRKLIGWLLLYFISVIILVSAAYQIWGRSINPQINLGRLLELSRQERKSIGAHPGRLSGSNYRNVALQALVYSVGGLYLPCGDRMCDREWVNRRAYRAYFYYLRGALFINGYAILVFLAVLTIFRKGLWLKEPLLAVIIFWFFLYISFFVFFNPWAGPVYAAELQTPLWAFFALVISRLRPGKIAAFLFLLTCFLFWNNYSVLRYLRHHYRDPAREAETRYKPAEPVFRPGGV